jgi:DNA-binding CsgD family transcriptional regulator
VGVGEQLDDQRSADQPLVMAAIRNGLATDTLSEDTFPRTTELPSGTVTALGFPQPPFGVLLLAGTTPIIFSPGAKKLLATITQMWSERGSARRTTAISEPQVTPENSGIIFSDRQLDVLKLLGEGMTNPQIGKTLSISASLAKQEVAFLSHALQAKSRLEVVVKAQRLGLLPVG